MFKRILIANRGEIAVRIIRACRELGIECVAAYSTADKNSIHVKLSDKSICIGPPSPSKSYLNMDNIISAALVMKCDAIHPGYGFLAENPEFVNKCQQNNLVFIGPPSETISLAGNKSKAIEVMQQNRIPVIPGSSGNVENVKEALKLGKRLGYPVVIKASFGGGGKGMRICNNKNELLNYFPLAKSESESSFGKPEVYIEKYISRPRHIEFQIIADNYGNIICVGERECSIQRRHQKLIEEAPAVNLPPKTVKLMREFAVRAAKAINYKNLGTIEFLLDEQGNFYFIEVNTRIQVEHPVTEMITGIDLVKEQIKIAAGEIVDNTGENYNYRGHSIEFRVNAEDPDNDFKPCPGKITNFLPSGGPGIRVDTFVQPGCEILPFYDSLIAKLIVWDRTRDEAILRSKRALDEFKIEGIKTTIPFYKKIIQNKNFQKGNIHTHFIEEEMNNRPI
ncbi:MAG: acetyl-CoA carboxylase biotin carboxylase subunit [Actinomycetota bacterium]|nr:acetyl-CoA carboxylase biotin carboxylase subunit [Actinomycetota bacterium]